MYRAILLTLFLLLIFAAPANAAFSLYPGGTHNYRCPGSQVDHTSITALSGAQFSSVKWNPTGLYEYWTSPLGGYLKFDGIQWWNNTSDFLTISPRCW